MLLLRKTFGWIARHALLFMLLVAAMVIYGQYRQSAASSQKLAASIERIDAAHTVLSTEIASLQDTAVTQLTDAERTSLGAIDTRIRTAKRDRDALQRNRPRSANLFAAPRDTIIASVRHDLKIETLDQEVAFLANLRRNVERRGKAMARAAQIADFDRRIADDAARIAALPSALSPNRYVRIGTQIRDLGIVYAERQAANAATRAGLVTARQRLGQTPALATPKFARDGLDAVLAPLEQVAATQAKALEASIEREAQRWYAQLGIADILPRAALVLFLVILTPFAIRTLFYWVLAPLASLQKPIQLLDPGVAIPLPAERSAVSRTISLTGFRTDAVARRRQGNAVAARCALSDQQPDVGPIFPHARSWATRGYDHGVSDSRSVRRSCCPDLASRRSGGAATPRHCGCRATAGAPVAHHQPLAVGHP